MYLGWAYSQEVPLWTKQESKKNLQRIGSLNSIIVPLIMILQQMSPSSLSIPLCVTSWIISLWSMSLYHLVCVAFKFSHTREKCKLILMTQLWDLPRTCVFSKQILSWGTEGQYPQFLAAPGVMSGWVPQKVTLRQGCGISSFSGRVFGKQWQELRREGVEPTHKTVLV